MSRATDLSLCMIVRNAAATIETCIASVRPWVAEVCIYLAGVSTDDTRNIVERLAAEPGSPIRVVQGEWKDDFAFARNQSFALASPGSRWLMFLDSDDELIAGDRLAGIVDEMERKDAPGCISCYWYEGDDGESSAFLRIMRADSGQWVGQVHEHWRFRDDIRKGRMSERLPELVVVGPPFCVRHRRHEHDPRRYLSLLREAATDLQRTPRALYFLAQTLGHVDDYAGALDAAQRYLETVDLDEGKWSEFRSGTLSYIVGAAAELGLDDLAVSVGEELVDYLKCWSLASRLDPEFISPPSFGERVDGSDSTDESAIHRAQEILDSVRKLAWVRGHRPPPLRRSPAPGRNEKCPCGSGSKFKRCCGR